MQIEKLGERIRRIRKEHGLSLRASASRAQISVAYLSKIEHDEANPTVDVLERLANTFGMSLEELTTGVRAETNHSHDLPESLRRFIEENADKYQELLDPDWQRMLASIRLRGRYPEKSEDWLVIFINTRRALE
jgi:transcriptional regulator with XRE-family HTH domain